jgi:Tripartite tricarboxylate transporter TctB family
LKIKSEKDFWSGLMFVVVGVAFAWGSLSYSFGSSARPGPAYFPFGLGVLMAMLGALVLFKALTIEVEGGDPIGHWPIKQGALILFAVVLFGLLLTKIGLALALPLLIGVSSLASGEFHLKEVLINCVVLAVGSWAIFIKGLSLIIPLWPAFLG